MLRSYKEIQHEVRREMDLKFKAAKKLAGLVVFNTKKPAYIHYEESKSRFIVDTRENPPNHPGYMLIEKVTEEIIPRVNVTVTEVFSTE